jgi:hypothetical protein
VFGFTPVELIVVATIFVLLIGSRLQSIVQRITGLRCPSCGRRVRLGDIGW